MFLERLEDAEGIALPPSLLDHSSVCRSHIARAIVAAGHADSMDDAFIRYRQHLDSGEPILWPSMESLIRIIHQAGGVAVLAHPGDALDRRLLRDLRKLGLDGIEVWHPSHGQYTTKNLGAMAFQMRLLKTGGSDFHSSTALLGTIGVDRQIWERQSQDFIRRSEN